MKTGNWKPSEKEIPKDDGIPIRIVLDDPTPPYPEIPQELLDDPSFQMLSVGNPNIHSCPADYVLNPPSFDPNAVKVNVAIAHHTHRELALGFLRYEALRKLHPRQFSELHARNLAGENFDDMVTKLVFQNP